MKTAELAGEYLARMRQMKHDRDLDELMRAYRIPLGAITCVCPAPTSISVDVSSDRYWPDDAGHPAWVMPVCVVNPERPELIETIDPLGVVSTGPVIDLVAFHPDYPGHWALRLGLATVLGAIEPQYLDPDPVPVWRDITDWLRADCRGIVLLTKEAMEAGHVLSQIHKIEAEDAPHAAELRRLLSPQPPKEPAVRVRAPRRHAA